MFGKTSLASSLWINCFKFLSIRKFSSVRMYMSISYLNVIPTSRLFLVITPKMAQTTDLLLLSHTSKVLFLALSVIFVNFFLVFVCAWNIPGTAERLCAIFTGKTCLVPGSEEFECQGHRSKVSVIRDKKRARAVYSHHPRQRRNGTRSLQMTSRSRRRHHSVAAGGDFSGLVWGVRLVKHL